MVELAPIRVPQPKRLRQTVARAADRSRSEPVPFKPTSAVESSLVALAILTCASPALADPLRLEDAVHEALERNERAKKAPLRITIAEGQRDRAFGAFLPSLTAAGTGSLTSPEPTAGNPTSSGTVTVQQPLISPSAFPLYAQARHQLESEKWGSIQDKRVLAFDTARAFLQVLAVERVLEAAKRRVERSRANVDNAVARSEAQLASVNDATRARLELANAAREIASAEGNVTRAYLQLGFLVGRPVTPPLVPPDRTTQAAEAVENADAQLRDALDRRPDVRAAIERTEALRSSAREPLYRLAPTLSAQGQVRVTPDAVGQQPGRTETVSLNLSWPIFDAGFRYADRRTRVAQAESQALDTALLKRSVANDVGLALASLRAAREGYRVTEEAVTAATKSIEETEILYRQGLARAIELTDATAKRFDAEVSRAAAKLQMEQAYLELRFALGLEPVEGVSAR